MKMRMTMIPLERTTRTAIGQEGRGGDRRRGRRRHAGWWLSLNKTAAAAAIVVVSFLFCDHNNGCSSNISSSSSEDSFRVQQVQAFVTPSSTAREPSACRRGILLKTTTTTTTTTALQVPLLPAASSSSSSSSSLSSSSSSSTTSPSWSSPFSATKPAFKSTRLYHMGHSHSHPPDDHQKRSSSNSNTTIINRLPIPTKSVLIRKLALVLVCFAFTCGSAVLHIVFNYKRAVTQFHWRTFLMVSTAAWTLTSEQTLTSFQRTRQNFQKRFHNFKDGLQRHHGGGAARAAAAAGTTDPTIIGSGGSSSSNAVVTLPSTSSSIVANENEDHREVDRVTWIGVIINLVLSMGKLAVGITQHSSVLIADAGHSLSDLVSDFITLWSVSVARLPPDEDHPYGHSKFEAIGSLFLSLTLLATAVSVGMHSNTQLMQILSATASKTAAAATTTAVIPLPGPLALVMAGISILSKEWLFRITRAVGRRLNSPVVLANAWHHRSDAYSSILALGSIAFAMAGFPAADAAAGMLVAVMIGSTGGDILMESVHQLSDSANEELQLSIAEGLNDLNDEDVLGVTSIRARSAGSTAHLDVVLETMPDLSTTATRAVEERVRRYLVHHLTSGASGEDGGGRLAVTATIHAKPNVVFAPDCPLLEQQHDVVGSHDHSYSHDDTLSPSSSLPAENEDKSNDDSTDVLPSATPPLIPGISAAQVQHQVRQQALLMYPKIRSVQGVTVHYSSQSSVTVEVNIQVDMFDGNGDIGSVTLADIQGYAHELKKRLETQSDEIEEARISLDLNGPLCDALRTHQ